MHGPVLAMYIIECIASYICISINNKNYKFIKLETSMPETLDIAMVAASSKPFKL